MTFNNKNNRILKSFKPIKTSSNTRFSCLNRPRAPVLSIKKTSFNSSSFKSAAIFSNLCKFRLLYRSWFVWIRAIDLAEQFFGWTRCWTFRGGSELSCLKNLGTASFSFVASKANSSSIKFSNVVNFELRIIFKYQNQKLEKIL